MFLLHLALIFASICLLNHRLFCTNRSFRDDKLTNHSTSFFLLLLLSIRRMSTHHPSHGPCATFTPNSHVAAHPHYNCPIPSHPPHLTLPGPCSKTTKPWAHILPFVYGSTRPFPKKKPLASLFCSRQSHAKGTGRSGNPVQRVKESCPRISKQWADWPACVQKWIVGMIG